MFLATKPFPWHYEGMDNRATNVWLGRIKVLRAWTVKSREIGQQAEVEGDERRRLLAGLNRASCFGSAQHLEPTTEAVIARRRYWLHVMPRSANALC